jgi:hypothetical protein
MLTLAGMAGNLSHGFTAIRNRLGPRVRLALDLRVHFTVLAPGQYGIAGPSLPRNPFGLRDAALVRYQSLRFNN